MGYEFKISKELTTLAATAGEWLSIADTVNTHLSSGDFHRYFNRMVYFLPGAYGVVLANLSPFFELRTQADFNAKFDDLHDAYQKDFLQQASRPRHYADAAYEEFLQFSLLKEYKTNYPILKRTFASLYEFLDKWVNNDAWIVMGIDVILKTLNRLFLDIASLKKQDEDDAWLVYHMAFTKFEKACHLLNDYYTELSERYPNQEAASLATGS